MVRLVKGIIMSESEFYKEGYKVGLNWHSPWTPGGPYYDKNCQCDVCKQDRLNNSDWLNGFSDGLRSKHKKARRVRPG